MINIKYASIRSMDITNGEDVGVALFVQGCRFKCKNCFNSETWDFAGGKEWTPKIRNKFLELIERPYVKRISILGGEPLAEENLDDVLDLVTGVNIWYNIQQDIVQNKEFKHYILCANPNEIRLSTPRKSIWLYTGYEWDHIFDPQWHYHPQTMEKLSIGRWKRQQIVSQCDVLIDGRYIEDQRDITLKWRGSRNQKVIDVQKSLRQGEVVLWCD